jgi:hypothetical protein
LPPEEKESPLLRADLHLADVAQILGFLAKILQQWVIGGAAMCCIFRS